ncbi:hypothetical protein A0H81_04793 [Grifola frondosa]|uniref:Tryptophanyl-tRNA synthetase n=1 Tax=Grifola frondosa TaxID=5627 RepID=A0A1C7MG64_GRIFR|nr:hypothetical protein A0H81_04793 [Grifola frondosa]
MLCVPASTIVLLSTLTPNHHVRILCSHYRRTIGSRSTSDPSSSDAHHAPPVVKPVHAEAHGQVVTPWDVQGSVAEDGKQLAIDYDKLIEQFGTRRVDAALLERFERLTGTSAAFFLRRGMFSPIGP